LRGQIHTRRPINYFLSLEYKGLDRPPEAPSFGITDFWFSIPIHKKVGTFTFGKIKETFVYEMVGDAANLPFLERTLNPFFVSRGIGIKLSNSVLNDRMTYAVGWFNDWFTQDQSFGESANDVTARITGLPVYSKDGANYLHLAASYRYAGGENGVVRLKGRPESNIASNFVDTGDIPASYQNAFGLELLANRGRFSVLGDYAESYVYSSTVGVAHFYGASVTATWTITGEHRPYDRKVGYARRIIPERRWGAWEVVARYSHLDLNNRGVNGGILHKGFVGLNWWASRQWRISCGYGLADLERKDLSSVTHILQSRFQWIF
jgi:phosphate-selective porin